MVDDTILPRVVDTKCFFVKVKPTRASKRRAKEVSVAVAERAHPNVNTQGVATSAAGEDTVLTTGLNIQGAQGSMMMEPRVPTRRERIDSVGDTGLDLLYAHVGSNVTLAPNATPWVTLGASLGCKSGCAPPGLPPTKAPQVKPRTAWGAPVRSTMRT